MGRFFIVLLFSFCAISVSGQNKDAELLNYETSISIRNDVLFQTEKVEIKINNRAGEKYTKVSIPYSKMIHVSDIEAYIIDATGAKIKSLKKSEITDKSAISDISFYEDNYVKEFTLKHNIYPYTLCYSFRVQQDEFFMVDYWQPVIAKSVPTLQATLTLEIPRDYKISFSNQLINYFKSDTSSSQIKYTWKTSYKDLLKTEIFSPPLEDFLPSVKIVPLKFKYDIDGSQNSWKELGNWQWNLIRDLTSLPADEKNKILSVISGTDDTMEKVRRLYHYLQDNVRYVNISIKTGGMKPYPASYVAQNKYGDCKALSNYFRSVLAAAGIKSYYSLVRADYPIISVLKSLPFQQFDHVIVCVPVLNDTLWLDCTSKLAFNYTGTFIQNHDAYIIDENNSHFSRIPPLTPDEVLESRKIRISPNITGSIAYSISYVFKGEEYETLSYLMREYNDVEKSRVMLNLLAEDGLEVADYKLETPARDIKEIRLSCSGKFNKLFRQYGNDQLISMPPMEIPSFEAPETRKLGVQIDFPIHKIDTIELALSDDYRLSTLPGNRSFSNDYGVYLVEFSRTGKNITVIRNFLLNSGKYSIENYTGFYNFIKEIMDAEKASVIVTSKKI